MRLFRKGSSGREVADIQGRLVAAGYLDAESEEARGAVFGDETDRAVRSFQQARGLISDGIVGPDTWRCLVDACRTLGERLLYLHEPPLRGDDVTELKRRLNSLGFYSSKEDGIFDSGTAVAVEQFQRNSGLSPDGMAGVETVEGLMRLTRVTKPTSVASVRESEKGLPSGGIQERRIMLDPGHGYPPDPGAVGPGGLRESEVAERLADILGGLLVDRSATVLYSRRHGEYLSDSERVRRANEQTVELVVSLHLNDSTDPRAGGCSCFYFARGNYRSPYGNRLAHHIQDELIARLALQDCRTHGRAYRLLRETRMPVVVVEPAFISNPAEESLLLDPAFLHQVASAMLEGTVSYFSGVPSPREEEY
ncbi:MAG: N-acetylmuramoyl-L-alanine amidase [Actinomycetota bacterium]